MTARELRDRLDRGEPLAVLDVREPVERSFCAIPVPSTAHDLFVPMSEIQERAESVRAELGTAPVVIYCHHGVRSLAVAEWLIHHGVGDVFNLEGGIDAWSRCVDPGVPRY